MKTKKGGALRSIHLGTLFKRVWNGSIWRRIALVFLAFVVGTVGTMYGVAQWYMQKHSNEPLVLGTTFIPDYAESFGLNSKDTLNAIFGDLGIRQVRLVSYWNDIEPVPGQYDFSNLDWQFDMANKYGAKISLAVGMRQPRWPECHEPDWIKVDSKQQDTWKPQLYKYMSAVIERYKNNPALASYQLENEFFMKVFGECKDFDRNRLAEELELVKKADPNHPIIISRSNNWVGIPLGKPTPDVYSVSVYKRVWDATLTKRYYEYPQPAWTYASLAGAQEIVKGKNMVIHELQAEPWPPRGQDIFNTSLEEQYKSMNAFRMKDRIDYGIATGMRSIDLWGAEWWYWLKVVKNEPGVWNVVKEASQKVAQDNQRLVSK
jgi:hypothetical protein